FWSGGGISCAQDAPQGPAALFANANVIDGVFNYQGSARTARHTIALVTWNDPADLYRSKIEYVEDAEGIARYGVRQTEVLAMGCTSRGQAHRLGRWLLYTERMETEVVSFRAGLDSVGCLPGEVIQIADAPRAGARMGGRLAACTDTSATLDAAVTLDGGESYTLSLVAPDGGIVSRPVTTAAGTVSVLSWTEALASVPAANALWVLSASNLEPTTWRVLSVSEPEKNLVEVTALAYNASKFAAIEQDLALEAPPTSLVYIGPPLPVTDLSLSESMYREEPVRIVVRLTAGWTPPAMGLSGFDVRIRPDNGNWRLVRRTSESTIDIDGMTPGLWEVSVTAISSTGQPAPAVYSTINILGETVPPSDVTGFTATASDAGIYLDWDDSPDVDIGDYAIRLGASWAAAEPLIYTKATAWTDLPRAPGDHTYWIAARDLMGNLSETPTSVLVTVAAAAAPAVAAAFVGGNCVLDWVPQAGGSFSVAEFEVRYGADWASGVSLGRVKGTTHTLLAQWSGNRTFWVAAYDLLGNVGAAGSVTAVVTPAPAPVVTSQGIDNNVLLYWSQVAGTLPTMTYEWRRGADWDSADLIGVKSGGFTVIFETVSGAYTYWVAAVDSAGNYGTPASVAATVNQPPDYVLRVNYDSDLSGTKSNLFLEEGGYLGPVDTTETFADHFTTRSWAGPADQIAAGYPIYAQPNASPAYYEETLDYGTLLASSKITVTANVQDVVGTVTPSCTISVSTDNAAWTDYAGVWSVYATNFRYVKVRVTLTAAGDTDLCRLLGLNLRIDAKLKTHTAMLSCVSTDSGGTILYLTDDGTSGGAKLFVDVDAINVSVQGTTPITPVYDFVDAADPLSLKVLLFNAAGARVSGTASITVRGF
ncbi:MAG TPA: phage tail protein, partial [Rhodocyclaceae bacterium]|nr:phage tail protein [Rhodocyclaceae bacterium]